MADKLKQVGRGIGQTHKNVEFLKRRGGYLPQVERTRGITSTAGAMIAPFVVNELERKLSLTLNFFDKPTGGGCEFGEIDDYVACELSWGVPYPYNVDSFDSLVWYGNADYPADGFAFGTGHAPQDFVANTGEFHLALGSLYCDRPGFYLVEHHLNPTGVTVSTGSFWQSSIWVNGTKKSSRSWTVSNGGVASPPGAASIQCCPLNGETSVTAIVELTGPSDIISFRLNFSGVAFYTVPNFAGAVPHTYVRLIGDPS